MPKKDPTFCTRVNVQDVSWTGSILRSSPYDLIDWHWFLWRYLVMFKVSFCDEVVTPGVTATSVLTSAECQRHTSSIWNCSGAPKVRLYDTFLGGLRHKLESMYLQDGTKCTVDYAFGNIMVIFWSNCLKSWFTLKMMLSGELHVMQLWCNSRLSGECVHFNHQCHT